MKKKLLILGSKTETAKDGTVLYLATTAEGEQVWARERIAPGAIVGVTQRVAGTKYKKMVEGKEVELEVLRSGYNLDYVINSSAELDNYVEMKARFTNLGF